MFYNPMGYLASIMFWMPRQYFYLVWRYVYLEYTRNILIQALLRWISTQMHSVLSGSKLCIFIVNRVLNIDHNTFMVIPYSVLTFRWLEIFAV